MDEVRIVGKAFDVFGRFRHLAAHAPGFDIDDEQLPEKGVAWDVASLREQVLDAKRVAKLSRGREPVAKRDHLREVELGRGEIVSTHEPISPVPHSCRICTRRSSTVLRL